MPDRVRRYGHNESVETRQSNFLRFLFLMGVPNGDNAKKKPINIFYFDSPPIIKSAASCSQKKVALNDNFDFIQNGTVFHAETSRGFTVVRFDVVVAVKLLLASFIDRLFNRASMSTYLFDNLQSHTRISPSSVPVRTYGSGDEVGFTKSMNETLDFVRLVSLFNR
uniref:Uncharacterized protein n=1 Tax=Romanomermis culicivorax TaxID=13658 RepID=A0A915HW89_ROMCU